jgi:outer membrane protein assembly factor BamD (BamD/ComL family)
MQIRVALIGVALSLLCLNPEAALAQGSRSAAAEAYDRGTAAYLDGSYEKAAQWFETANRLAPAAPALMQAVRAHHKAGSALKASSLALQL